MSKTICQYVIYVFMMVWVCSLPLWQYTSIVSDNISMSGVLGQLAWWLVSILAVLVVGAAMRVI